MMTKEELEVYFKQPITIEILLAYCRKKRFRSMILETATLEQGWGVSVELSHDTYTHVGRQFVPYCLDDNILALGNALVSMLEACDESLL